MIADFIRAACVPLDRDHSSGTLTRAAEILAEHPEIAESTVYTAAILGDETAVRRFLAQDPVQATAKGGPHGWDALTHLCFSTYLKLDPARSPEFVGTAEALLEAGASPNTGWFEQNHQPKPEWEPVLYGAAGVAHHPDLTRLLLSRGADPNDDEVVYHTPEGYDNRALMIVVETGKLTPESLSLMLIRKHDWHDTAGVRYLLEHGADPRYQRRRGDSALPHAIARDNDVEIIEMLLDHGADPTTAAGGISAVARAARRGRGDILASLARRDIRYELQGVDRLIAACAANDPATIRAISESEPRLVAELVREGGQLLAEFAGNDNRAGVRHLIRLGVPVGARFEAGDGYWGVAKRSSALHVAAWRLCHATVKCLLEAGAPVDPRNGTGQTPLTLAINGCVNSYWTERKSPASVAALLDAGASLTGVPFPSGYHEVDELLRARGARA